MKFKTENELAGEISDRVRALRTNCGMTQAEISKRSGLSLGSYRRFEQTGRIEFLSLIRVAKVLHAEGEFDRLFPPPVARSLDELEKSPVPKAIKKRVRKSVR